MKLKIPGPKNLNAQLVDTIGQRIVKGHYKEGEQLPVEADLCDEFGVSRSILREAIKMLAAKGFLLSRPRVGTVVQKRSQWNLMDGEVLNWVTRVIPPAEYLDMMFEARMMIEPAAAGLAARKATKEDIAAIGLAYAEMATAKTLGDSLGPDIRFHLAIMEASHNAVICNMGHTLHKALAISIKLTSWNQNIHKLSLPRHEAIYLAISHRDVEGAVSATQWLLKESRKDFDQKKIRTGAR